MAARLAEMLRTVELAQSGDFTNALALVRTNAGNLAMQSVRRAVAAFDAELDDGMVRQIGAGSVLDVDAVPGTVRILVNGRRVGDGELVSIDGRAGVRITAFAPGLDGDSVP